MLASSHGGVFFSISERVLVWCNHDKHIKQKERSGPRREDRFIVWIVHRPSRLSLCPVAFLMLSLHSLYPLHSLHSLRSLLTLLSSNNSTSRPALLVSLSLTVSMNCAHDAFGQSELVLVHLYFFSQNYGGWGGIVVICPLKTKTKTKRKRTRTRIRT